VQIETLDLEFQSIPNVIASYLVLGAQGPVLVETGPSSTLTTLVQRLDDHGIAPADIRHVLVTHIHLDHAGAAGWWAQQGAQIYVHPFGAPHLVDPGRLVASAERIYGDRMKSFWGEIPPAPPDKVVPVQDGEVIDVAGLAFTAIETPGHARHHHVYQLGEIAFAGDAAGIRLPGATWIDVPAPPPEFDREAWKASIAKLRSLGLSTLCPTHYGPTTEVDAQLDVLEAELDTVTQYVRAMIDEGLDRDAMVERYTDWLEEREAKRGVVGDLVLAHDIGNPRPMSVDGIARYWRKRAESEG
jgi:glyoxylase-like metal-dependent hydrolase (beta-lactamase superfamily II)